MGASTHSTHTNGDPVLEAHGTRPQRREYSLDPISSINHDSAQTTTSFLDHELKMIQRLTAADDDNSGPQRSTKHYCYGNAIACATSRRR